MKVQVKLQQPREPLQIPFPAGWGGEKSGNPDDTTLLLNQYPRWVTPDELLLAEDFVTRLSYRQAIEKTGAVLIDEDDPLLSATHDDLDKAEAAAQLPNTRGLSGGGVRSIQERVLIIRERGYQGGAFRALNASPDVEATTEDAPES